MAKLFDDGSSVLPWPRRWRDVPGGGPVRDLANYAPAQWPCKAMWHGARASVARSLGRKVLPEIRAMTEW